MLKKFAHYIVFGDPMTPFYQYIDFDRAVIGGSYALNQYTKDYMWIPDDVDVMTTARDIEHFTEIVDNFQTLTCGKLLKFNDFSKGHPDDVEREIENRRDEKFHESIKASAKIQVDGLKHAVQYVWIQGLEGDTGGSPEQVLSEITDLPACVNYKVDPVTNEKHFNVPNRAIDAINTRIIQSENICPSRKAKYEQRGYKFN